MSLDLLKLLVFDTVVDRNDYSAGGGAIVRDQAAFPKSTDRY